MTVVPDGKNTRPVTITIPNTSAKSRTISPPAQVASLADKLKVGDPVRVSYDQLGSMRTYKAISPLAPTGVAPGKGKGKGKGKGRTEAATAAEPMTFTFSSTRKVRYNGTYYEAVTATKGSLSWTFLLPNTEVLSSGGGSTGKSPAAAGKPSPDPELLAKVKRYRRGDEVSLSYKPSNYVFLLSDIEAVQLSDEGTVTTNREIRSGRLYRMVQVRAARTLVLCVPLEADDGGPAASQKLIAAAEALKPRQKVAFKYHKQGGRCLLDEITVQ